MSQVDDGIRLKPGLVLSGALFSEPMRIVTVTASGAGRWTLGLVGARSERFRSVTLGDADLNSLTRVGGDHSTEATAMRVVMEFERAQNRVVTDVHEKNLGYDITSLDPNSGELRLIEIKGMGAATGRILLTPNERRVAEDRRDCYWLYVVTHCDTAPKLEDPIKDPARIAWHEVIKVQHYWLEVDAVSQPMGVRGHWARSRTRGVPSTCVSSGCFFSARRTQSGASCPPMRLHSKSFCAARSRSTSSIAGRSCVRWRSC